jgi:hypothetical protein
LRCFSPLSCTPVAHLLPDSVTDARSSFENFDAARQALERIEPYKTKVGELKQLGFDWWTTAT